MIDKEYFNYGEALCDAVDIIVSEKLKTLGYDITKVCTIIDDDYKELGRYTVQEENIKYEAYSINTNYQINDSVLVVIPNGDYSMQKNIIGKAVVKNSLTDSPLYESPLKSMLDFTGNILENKINEDGNTNTEFSLLANHPERKMKLLYSIDWDQSLNDYDRMGISADFQTWFNNLDIISGSYGLLFYFYGFDSSSLKDAIDIPLKENNTGGYIFTFNTNDILGNPYYFESYFTHEKVIDISYLKNVKKLEIYFYQNQDFKDSNNKLISYQTEIDEEFSSEDIFIKTDLNDNLFINNLKLLFGYSSDSFSGDVLKLTTNNLNYSSLTLEDKILQLKWIHKVEKNKYILLDNTSNCELYWVRNGTTQQTISNIVGNYWNEYNITVNPDDKFKANLNLKGGDEDLTKNSENRVKVVGRIQQEDGNWVQYESNILTFVSTDLRVDQTTLDAATGLSIRCADNTEGIYLMYNQNSEIINKGLGEGYNRVFEIYYKNKKLSSMHEEIDEVRWILPINTSINSSYTMLQYSSENLKQNLDSEEIIDQDKLTSNRFERIVTNPSEYHQNYSILNNWYIQNAHNTVSCEVYTKKGDIYKASKELIFGKANSQGSNISLIVQYKDNKNAYEIITNTNNEIMGTQKPMEIKGLAYDLSGKLLPAYITNKDNTRSSLWKWEILSNNSEFIVTNLDNGNCILQLKRDGGNFSDINNPFNYFNILKGTYRINLEENSRTVEVFFPIAIKTLDKSGTSRCQTIDGAREIIYDSQGNPNYYTDIYKLINNNGQEINGIEWDYFPKNDSWGPTLKEISQNENNIYKALLANPIFIKEHNYQTYIIAKSKTNNLIYWIQPILIMQSQYDFSIINNWNGITTTTEGASIISTMIAAGKKDEKESFSGILIGDVIEAGINKGQIGLYGISKGDITFSLTDKGLASFEKIVENADNTIHSNTFLGEENYILSHDKPIFDNNGNEIGCSNHLLFDIDGRKLEFKNDSSKSGGIFLSTGSPYLRLDDNNGSSMLLFNHINGETKFLIQSPNFSNSSGLQLDVKNGIIKVINGIAQFSQNNNYIGTVDNGTDLLKLGSVRIAKNGEFYYNSSTLENYIREIAREVISEEI